MGQSTATEWTAYFLGESSAQNSDIFCASNTICHIICGGYLSCDGTTLLCDGGGECDVTCDQDTGCPIISSDAPTRNPTKRATPKPTPSPTGNPTKSPSSSPTAKPTNTKTPTLYPTSNPSSYPSEIPMTNPTDIPTPEPTELEVVDELQNNDQQAVEVEEIETTEFIVNTEAGDVGVYGFVIGIEHAIYLAAAICVLCCCVLCCIVVCMVMRKKRMNEKNMNHMSDDVELYKQESIVMQNNEAWRDKNKDKLVDCPFDETLGGVERYDSDDVDDIDEYVTKGDNQSYYEQKAEYVDYVHK